MHEFKKSDKPLGYEENLSIKDLEKRKKEFRKILEDVRKKYRATRLKYNRALRDLNRLKKEQKQKTGLFAKLAEQIAGKKNAPLSEKLEALKVKTEQLKEELTKVGQEKDEHTKQIKVALKNINQMIEAKKQVENTEKEAIKEHANETDYSEDELLDAYEQS